MDNLHTKTIKQFYYDTDNGTLCITMLKDKKTKQYEWWGHMVGFCRMEMLFGGAKIPNRTLQETADYCAYEYYDIILDTMEGDD